MAAARAASRATSRSEAERPARGPRLRMPRSRRWNDLMFCQQSPQEKTSTGCCAESPSLLEWPSCGCGPKRAPKHLDGGV
eukprot:15479599-Alexandrium_andersonii.AAC.1